MVQIKEVSAYETSDGTVFKDITDATAYQSELDFEHWYQTNYLLGNFAGSKVELQDMKDWLKSNKDVILSYIGRD